MELHTELYAIAKLLLSENAPESLAEIRVRINGGTSEIEVWLDSLRLTDLANTEYLGTTQIITLATAAGARVKARISADLMVRPGETTGLTFRPQKLSLFDQASGRVLRSALHDEAAHG